MPQLHLYVPDDVAERLKRRAERAGLSVSRYLAGLAERDAGGGEWPEGYFERVFGQPEQEPLERPPEDQWKNRPELE
jgi:hypothetical protein